MAITYEPQTEIVLPNITVEKQCSNGVHIGYKLTPADGYVLHNPNNCDTDTDPDTGEEVVYHYYYRAAYLPLSRPVETWTWEAVPEEPGMDIFGGGNTNHEVM